MVTFLPSSFLLLASDSMSGSELEILQLSSFILQVRGDNLNNREIYQSLNFTDILKKGIHILTKYDVMQNFKKI
jgi:hypothetical protein